MDDRQLFEAKILVVDDEPSQIAFLESVLRATGYVCIHSTSDACQALPLVKKLKPDLLVLDLHMPRANGFEVMQQLQLSPLDEREEATIPLPILVISGDHSPEIKIRALDEGAHDFLPRPYEPREVQLRVQKLLESHFIQLQLQEEKRQLEECVLQRTQDLEQTQLEVKEAQLEVISRLALAGELHDNDTGEHCQRVSLTVSLIAQNLGMTPETVELLRRAAPLHDVGKIGIADPILMKNESLTESERDAIKEHCRIGAQVLSGGHAELIQMAETIALNHHEHWDGNGYPNGLKGEDIPLEARILAVADVFDALTHARPYKDAWSIEAALGEIRSKSGSHFDPRIVEAFLQLPHESLI